MISPYVRKLRLAEELRRLRTDAGLTHEQLAKKIGQSRAQISRLENGHVADQDDVMRILDALEVHGDEWTKIMTFAREAGERGWWESNRAMGERQALYANLEAGAKTIREFAMTFIPGLLQSPSFTRYRVEADSRQGVKFDVAKIIEAREGRQRMLRRPNGPDYRVILDEVAIRRFAAPEEVVRQQLYHVAKLINENEGYHLRVLPIDVRVPTYNVPRGAFSVYTFSEKDDPTIVLVDTVTSDLEVHDQDEAQRYVDLFDGMWEAAFDEERSLDVLSGTAEFDERREKALRTN
jgi:transcriptional regulator with XRE-family HTH domain